MKYISGLIIGETHKCMCQKMISQLIVLEIYNNSKVTNNTKAASDFISHRHIII